MKTRTILIGAAALALIAILITGTSSQPALAHEATTYKSASCGCCGGWVSNAQRLMDVEAINTDDVSAKKAELGVPEHLHSCHTTTVDDYFIEGHVPAQAVEKLLTEQPDIAGIALPGMPSGTPGMPGPKRGAWTITAVHHDGSTMEFMTI